ncbi:methyltransferase domain-containing protein [Streptomyces sp. NPDC059578]|uniref:methyltransferase domain-containing protein n=1 Tax=Streptomyces sp. NPDC059578 TaxID=3346874 RepID=UPI003689D9E3
MTTTTPHDEAADLRRRLADSLTSGGALSHTSPWHKAFAAVSREAFVPRFSVRSGGELRSFGAKDAEYLAVVYSDDTLVTRRDEAGTPVSSSSTPSLMARMLEAFTVADGAQVLEIGTGTGYNSALLCHRLGSENVTTIDVDPDLTATARERLAVIGYTPLVVTSDGTRAYTTGARYDGVLATCGVDRVPAAWVRQVRPGGVIVTNIGDGIVRLVVDGDGTARGGFLPDEASFMRARPTADHVAPTAPEFTGLVVNGKGVARTVDVPVPDDDEHDEMVDRVKAFFGEFVHRPALEIGMLQHDVLAMTLDPEGDTMHGLVHPESGSWARITPRAGARALVEYGGPRDLVTERLALTTQWLAAGRPHLGAYTLAVTADGAHTLSRAEPAARSWAL